jgi:CelD/BcsL family acetyltransferase involved in cellulose biosynthesis
MGMQEQTERLKSRRRRRRTSRIRSAISSLRADRGAKDADAIVSITPVATPEEGVRVIRSLSDLEAIRPIWESISPSWATPMQSFDWVRICAEVFGLGEDLEVVVLGKGPHAAIAPMFRVGPHGTRLEMIGANQLYEVTDFVHSDRSDTAALARALARYRLPIRLERIPADSPIPSALYQAFRGTGVVLCRENMGCPWIALDQTWIDPEAKLPKHRRQNLRRARRIAEGMGPVSFEILSPNPGQVEAVLRVAYAIEAAGWKAERRSALAVNTQLGEFYRRYAAVAAEQGILRLCILQIGGQPAAMQIAVETGKRFWVLKIGYSQEFARCSPGTLLMTEAIRYAARSGLRTFEFLGVDEPWIRAWNPLMHRCLSVRAYPFSVRGALAAARDVVAMSPKEARALFGKRR